MVATQAQPRLTRGQVVFLVAATVWSLLVLAAVLWVPFYGGESVSSSQAVTAGGRVHRPVMTQVSHQSATLGAVNGSWVVWMALVPCAISLVVAGALWRRRGRSSAGVVAWAAVALLGLGTLTTMLTIGIFVAPVTGALIVACALHGSGSSPSAGCATLGPCPATPVTRAT